MSRIIYGVSGEGSGHSSRAREMLGHLIDRGHDVRVLSYDRGYRNLHADFPVTAIAGLHIVNRNNRVSPLRTVVHNLRKLPELRASLRQTRALFESFRPACVITDFEPISAWTARSCGVPVISLDNQHRMRYMDYGKVGGAGFDELVTRTIIKLLVPRPTVSLVTTFFFGRVANEHTFLFPPILRGKVLERTVREGDHVLVYVTQAFEGVLDLLRQFPEQRVRAYGYDRSGAVGNIEFRPFSVDGFLDDLASARAVVATAGFTLLTESLHLGKPYFALPMKGQFEQMLNGHLLVRLDYGVSSLRPDVDALRSFFARQGEYRERMIDYPRADSSAIKAKLDELLANDEALLRDHHERRYGKPARLWSKR